MRDFAINEKKKLKNKVRKLYKNGMKPKDIARVLRVNYRVVNGWLFEAYKYKNTRLSQRMLLSYEEWLKQSKLGERGAVWEKIVSKDIEDLNDVRDFTTVENTHSFIANGFITHNCPIETPEGTPIGLRKNLSLLCNVSHSDVDDKKIIKYLENAGLEIQK